MKRELDVESMARYILIQEIISNVEMDNYPSMRSGFIHRRDDDSLWVMGPLWDCDGGFNYNWGDMYDSRGWGHTYFENYRTLIFGSDPLQPLRRLRQHPVGFLLRPVRHARVRETVAEGMGRQP